MASDTFIAEARERFLAASESDRLWKQQCLEDFRFSIGEIDGVSTQWREADQAARRQEGKPCLTINRVPQFVRQVANEGRQNNPSIKISPVDDSGDIETAEVLQGMVRHIEVSSFADIARATAREHMLRMGFGYTRILTEYCDEQSFDQDIKIARVLNPFSVYFDPGAQEPDYSDAGWAFVTSTITHEHHKRLFPGKRVSSAESLTNLGDEMGDWLGRDGGIRIVEYFYFDYRKRKLVAVEVGQETIVGFQDEMDQHYPGARILRERDVQMPIVKWCKMNGIEKLEETDWLGRYIPIIPYIGEEYLIEGRRHVSGMVRSAKPAQYMYNYWVTTLTEVMGQAPKSPWVVAEGQIEGYEHLYATANVKNHPYLIYKPTTVDGLTVPPPQRQAIEPAIQAITLAVIQADRDLKATFGIYEAGLGQKGPQESGKAIEARKVEGDIANYHLIDNESRSRRYEGRQLVDLIPKVYDRERVARIVLPDDSTQTVQLGRPTVYKGVERIFDLKTGRYDVTVSVGPGFQTKRQQASESIQALMSAFPEIMPVAGDILVKAMDFPYAQEVADRMKKMLPPQLQEEQDGAQQVPPEVQQKMAEMGQMVEQLTAQLTEAQDMLRTKQAELESKERISAADNEVKVYIAELQAETQKAIAMLREETAAIKARMDAAGRDEDREFNRETSEADRELQRESGDKEREVKREAAAAKAKNGGGEK